MDKNLTYRSLYLHFVEGLKLSEVSNETGLRANVVRAITQGVREPEVANDFFNDRKAGDFSREYPQPKYNKLGKIDYAMLESRYISLINNDMATIKDISSYLIEDDIEPKQANKMLKTLTRMYEDKKDELMDKKLQAIIDVLSQPSKWVLTDTGIKTMYAVPVLDEKLSVIDTELKPSRSFVIPDELWNRYVEEATA